MTASSSILAMNYLATLHHSQWHSTSEVLDAYVSKFFVNLADIYTHRNVKYPYIYVATEDT